MKVGDTITIMKDHKHDASVALSARRAGYTIETMKVIQTNSKLENEQAIRITLKGFYEA